MKHPWALAMFAMGLAGALWISGLKADPTPESRAKRLLQPPRAVTFQTRCMGTVASLQIVTTDSSAVADVAYQSLVSLHFVDSLMSNWTDTSEIARINRKAGSQSVTVHPEVGLVLGIAQTVSSESHGAFDITVEPLVRLWGFIGGSPRVPSQQEIDATLARIGHDQFSFNPQSREVRFLHPELKIDFGGIAKGYGVDRSASILRQANVPNALIDLSGNMTAFGNAPGKRGWLVGIRDPESKAEHVATVRLHDQSIATSGGYEQFVADNGKHYGHILDPRTGWSAEGIASVTVVSATASLCDAWATALYVMGPEDARAAAAAREDFSAIIITPQHDGTTTIWVETALRGQVTATNDAVKVAYF